MQSENKIGICIITYNLETRVFILQIESIRRFCLDKDYVIEVIDNSTDTQKSNAVNYHAGRLGVKYRKTIPVSESPSRSHAFAANFAYQKLKDEYNLLAFFDHDLIPVKPFSVSEILGDKIMAGVSQGIKVKYLWPGCLFINNELIDRDMVRFDPNHILKLDTGGDLYKVIEKYGNDKIGWLDETGCQNPVFNEGFYYFYIMIHDKTFLHFLNTSNWKKEEKNEERVNSLINITIEIQNK